MSDARIRDLERRSRTGDLDAMRSLAAERARAGRGHEPLEVVVARLRGSHPKIITILNAYNEEVGKLFRRSDDVGPFASYARLASFASLKATPCDGSRKGSRILEERVVWDMHLAIERFRTFRDAPGRPIDTGYQSWADMPAGEALPLGALVAAGDDGRLRLARPGEERIVGIVERAAEAGGVARIATTGAWWNRPQNLIGRELFSVRVDLAPDGQPLFSASEPRGHGTVGPIEIVAPTRDETDRIVAHHTRRGKRKRRS